MASSSSISSCQPSVGCRQCQERFGQLSDCWREAATQVEIIYVYEDINLDYYVFLEYRQRTQKRRFYLFNLYSWGFPASVTLVTLMIHLFGSNNMIKPEFGQDRCIFSSYLSRLVYFHGIIAVILVINLIFFMASAYNLLFGLWSPSSNNVGDSGKFQKTRQMLWVVLELFLVMGLTWLAEVVSLLINWVKGTTYAGWEIILFDIINSLQGLLIFLVLICKPRIRYKIRAAIITIFSFCNCSTSEQDTTMVGKNIFYLI